MDTKRLILAMAVMLAVLFGWEMFARWYTQKYAPPQVSSTQTTTTQSTETIAPPSTGQAVPPTLTSQPTSVAGLRAASADEKPPIAIGSSVEKNPTFAMGIAINPRGAGIDSVRLNQFTNTVKDRSAFIYQTPYADKPETRPLATRSVTIKTADDLAAKREGTTINLADAVWTVDSTSEAAATLHIDIVSDNGPVARLYKTFKVQTLQESAGKSDGYVVDVMQTIENLSAAPITISSVINGPTDPPKDIDRAGDRQVISGHLKDGKVLIQHLPLESFSEKKKDHDLTVYEDAPALWIGTSNAYFNAILRPVKADNFKPTQTVRLSATAVHLPQNSSDNQVSLTLQTTDLTIPPGGKDEVPLEAFFGPRIRSMLQNDYYSALPLGYSETLVLTSGPCGFCTIPALVDGLVHLLKFFHGIFKDWGVAIILLVLLVRACLHPITKRAQVNMMKMGKLGPEIERLKKKYGDNKEEFAKAQMGLYKQMGFTPVLGCLPLFLQMPIFIALFMSLNTTFELRQAPFLYGLTWIDDLSRPDMLWSFSRPVDLWLFSIDAFNLLPLLVAVVQYLSFKYTPRPPATTPEQEQQQKMMQWMTLIFPLMFYKMPSGLNLYYLTSTGLGIIEGKITRDHIKKQEELEKLQGPVIVDAGMTKRKSTSLAKEEPKKQGGLGGLWQKLQNAAEKAREEAEKRSRNK